jgi:hypothetical protein
MSLLFIWDFVDLGVYRCYEMIIKLMTLKLYNYVPASETWLDTHLS